MKNRREIEFASCGVPLALNYKPTYLWPFRPGIEYFHLDSAARLKEMIDTDPAPFAKASAEVYRKYLCAEGQARLLLKMLDRVREGKSPLTIEV